MKKNEKIRKGFWFLFPPYPPYLPIYNINILFIYKEKHLIELRTMQELKKKNKYYSDWLDNVTKYDKITLE